MNQQKILLNCDVGESYGIWSMGMDETVMPLVDMANIACGFHAGDPLTLSRTISFAKQAGTRLGAHPSYPDLVGFGRRSMQCSAAEIIAMLHYQIGALQGICQSQGVAVTYVKPHGALYNDMLRDDAIFRAVLEAVATLDASLPLMVLAGANNAARQQIADEFNIKLLFEAFADRAYDDDGCLVSRLNSGAVYDDPEQIVKQSLRLAKHGEIQSVSGRYLSIHADTLCVHGDNPAAVSALRTLRKALDDFYAEQ